MGRMVRGVAGCGLVLLSLVAVGSAPAGAGPASPVVESPDDGAAVDGNPTLRWDRVAGAATYQVQVASDTAFTSRHLDATTVNTSATPPTDLAAGTYLWRVRAVDATGATSAWATRSFVRGFAAAPNVTSPADGAVLELPGAPVVFAWEALAGARTYQVDVAGEPTFAAAQSFQTAHTSYAMAQPQPIGQQLYWRVKGISPAGASSDHSAPRAYSLSWPDGAPVPTYPPDTTSPTIEEVTLAWQAVAGAVTYQLQVSPNGDFTNNKIIDRAGIRATRFTPPTTLPAGAYFWRVKSVNSAGSTSAWSAVRRFARAWPTAAGANDTITLLAPANGAPAVREPTLSWTAQRLASRYEIWLGTDVNFSPGTYATCQVNHTSYTPKDGCGIDPAPGGQQWFWKVRAVDQPANVNGPFSSTSAFTFFPAIADLTGPDDGFAGDAPVLTWDPVPGIASYEVTVKSGASTVVLQATVTSTTFVPGSLGVGGPFSWNVRTVDATGGLGPIPNGATDRHFSIVASAAPARTPEPTSAPTTSSRPPLMTWTPVAGADHYEVWFLPQGGQIAKLLGTEVSKVPAYAYTGANPNAGPGGVLTPQTYEWYVVAYDAAGVTLAQSVALGAFTIANLDATTLTGPDHCPADVTCPSERDTPTLRWDAVDGASWYIVDVATDPQFTNKIRTWTTKYSQLTPLDSLPDSQAGQALYWYARPCAKQNIGCGPDPTDPAVQPFARAFRKSSAPVDVIDPNPAGCPVTVGPPDPACQFADEITFRWADYLATTDQGARSYTLQISDRADFSTVLDSQSSLDATEYTRTDLTLPEGPIYWRVAAQDASGNVLTFSSTHQLLKRSSPVALSVPADGAQVTAIPTLRWVAQPFARQYVVEIYRNVGQSLTFANRVFTSTVGVPAASVTSALPVGTYGWRVQRLDADNRPGPWSADTNAQLRTFTVTGDQPQPLAPVDHAVVTDDDIVFSWLAVPGAVSYRLQTSGTSAFTTLIENQATVMTAWAPQIHYADGATYWRVLALDANGDAMSTSETRELSKDQSPSGSYTPVTPHRVLDTRATNRPLGPGESRAVDVTGNVAVPAAGVSAVVVNVTAVQPTAAGWLTLYPNGTPRPVASNLNFRPGDIVPNLVTVGVDATGNLRVFNQAGTTHVILDIIGFYANDAGPLGSRFTPTANPTRIEDTRTAHEPWQPDEQRDLQIAGVAGVPADATAVVVNVTAVSPSAPQSFLTVWPTGAPRPTASNLNYTQHQIVPNLVIVKVGAGQRASVYNQAGSVDLVFDVVGYFQAGTPPPGRRYQPLPPARILDTREPGPDGGVLVPAAARPIPVVGRGGVPAAGVTAVVLNVTVTQPAAGGYLTVWPSGPVPTASNLNYRADQSVANLVVAKVSGDGTVQLQSSVATHAVFDVVGWYGLTP